jgi:hypothetical protein
VIAQRDAGHGTGADPDRGERRLAGPARRASERLRDF